MYSNFTMAIFDVSAGPRASKDMQELRGMQGMSEGCEKHDRNARDARHENVKEKRRNQLILSTLQTSGRIAWLEKLEADPGGTDVRSFNHSLMGVRQSHGVFLLCLTPVAGFSNVQCTAPVCPKDRRPVRKLDGPKIWAFGCDVPEGNGTLHRCCVEKEICMRTCGMPWKKCGRQFEKCSEKACDMDEDCIAVAEGADLLITGGTSHFTVPWRSFLAQGSQTSTPSMLRRGWWMGKSRTLRRSEELHLVFEANPFHATIHCLVSLRNTTMSLQEVWKKWHNREAELFYELARKYKTEAVEMRVHSEVDLDRLRDINKHESQQTQAKLEPEASEADLQEERLRQRLAEEEALAEKEIAQRRAQVAELESAKASAVAAEDFLRAKEMKRQLDSLAEDSATEAPAVSTEGGVKRPLEQSESDEANKRQNTGTITSKSMAAASKAASKAVAKSAA
eukprot:symbB.v1.2.010429.t2/scaffold655.1/size176010/16